MAKIRGLEKRPWVTGLREQSIRGTKLTSEVAVEADGNVVKCHCCPGSWPPPRDYLQPEPVWC